MYLQMKNKLYGNKIIEQINRKGGVLFQIQKGIKNVNKPSKHSLKNLN